VWCSSVGWLVGWWVGLRCKVESERVWCGLYCGKCSMDGYLIRSF